MMLRVLLCIVVYLPFGQSLIRPAAILASGRRGMTIDRLVRLELRLARRR